MGKFNLSQKAISEIESFVSLTDKGNGTLLDAWEKVALIDDYLRDWDISTGEIKEVLYEYRKLLELCKV